MDHMMPKMDGMETTQKLREMGYTDIIVALTANALAGNDEMFKRNGFDGFIAKPIDIRQLNAALNKYVRDRYPEEAKKYRQERASVKTEETGPDPKLIQIFCRDAEKAVKTLREAIENSDMKTYTTTVHAMKSALANIGRDEASLTAQTLEEAGHKNDGVFIAAHTDNFIHVLEAMVQSLATEEDEPPDNTDADAQDDTVYLAAQLRVIKSACEDYDDTPAFAALALLNERKWKKETAAILGELHEMLFLHSEFDAVVERIDEIIPSLPPNHCTI
jgi:CheY-like chemotaxis protein